MGSLAQVFKGQVNVWSFGKTLSAYLVHSQSSAAADTKKQQVKRPASPFALFFQSKQSTLREQNPNLRQAEIMKLASTLWKKEGAETHQHHREEFGKKMVEYKASMKEVPRRPKPPFIQFFSDKNSILRYSYPNVVERAKKASEMWKNLSMIERQRYKTAYKNKLTSFADNLSDEESDLIQERKDALNLKRQQRDVRRYGKGALKERPVAPIANPFSLLVHEKAAEVPRNENVLKYLGGKWRDMSQAERITYKQKVDNAMKIYEKDFDEWQRKHDRFSQK